VLVLLNKGQSSVKRVEIEGEDLQFYCSFKDLNITNSNFSYQFIILLSKRKTNNIANA
jgi:hypothetical protein